MTKRKNMAASVHDRLLRIAHETQRPFNEVLQQYAMERVLYRLAQSEHCAEFVLKGALMFRLWGYEDRRTTRDIDLLSRVHRTVEETSELIRRLLSESTHDDGLVFPAKAVVAQEIRASTRYGGVRVRCLALLGVARVPIQVDVGYGDAVSPPATMHDYPTFLDSPAPRLYGYPPETVVAEKFEAMVSLDLANTRMKDFFDVWTLSMHHPFDGTVLRDAVQATFVRRATPWPQTVPSAFSAAFYSDPTKQLQWSAYLRKSMGMIDTPTLPQVAADLRAFLLPILESARGGQEFAASWTPGGPWASRGPT